MHEDWRSWVVLAGALLELPAAPGAAQDSPSFTAAAGTVEPDAEDDLPQCKTDLRLSGTFYNATRPDRSLVTFQVASQHRGEVHRVGSRVASFEIMAVEPRGALLRDGEHYCWLRLVGVPPSERRPEPAAPKAKAPRSERKRR